MTWTFEWLEEGHVSLVTISENLDTDQVNAWMGRAIEMMNTYNNTYHTIVDMTRHPRILLNPLQIPTVFEAVRHPNFGWLVLVGTSPLISFWLELFHRSARLRFKVFPTIPDGVDFIQGQRLREVNTSASAPDANPGV